MLEKPPYSKISYPSTPTKMGKDGVVEFKWESGADVQALWRKHGWTPPSEGMPPPPPERKRVLAEQNFDSSPLRRVR